MRLWQWLALALGLAAAIPLLLVGGSVALLSRRSMAEQSLAVQRSAVDGVAAAADLWLQEVERRLQLTAEVIDFGALDEEARVGALRLIYRQIESSDIVGLYGRDGRPLVPEVFLRSAGKDSSRLPVNEDEVARFRARLPIERAWREGVALGTPYRIDRKHVMGVVLAARVAGGLDAVLAIELLLTPLERVVVPIPGDEVGTAFLVDETGQVLVHADGTRLGRRSGRVLSYLGGDVEAQDDQGRAWVGTAVRLRAAPWAAVVERPRSVALREANALLRRIAGVLGVAIAFAILAGFLLARIIGRPVQRVARSASALAAGDLEARSLPGGPEEIRALAEAFNTMAEALKASLEEIEAFNRELQDRVEERTEALKQAQAQLLQSRKLAAVGELGAGVAHELNNPLTGILGMAQLMLGRRPKDDPERKYLERIEKDAKRCREVTMNLLRFSEQGEREERDPFDLREAIEAALTLRRAAMEEVGIEVETDLPESPLTILGSLGKVQEVVLALLSNAVQALPGGGTVRVRAWQSEGFAHFEIMDGGVGIPKENLARVFEPFFSTKSDWRSAGLGLSVAHRIVETHGGKIRIESEEGEGTTVRVRLPLAGEPGTGS